MDLHTNFLLDWPKIAEVIPFFHFWLVGWLGRSACMDFADSIVFKAPYPGLRPCKISRGYLKAFSRYPFFKIGLDDNDDDINDTNPTQNVISSLTKRTITAIVTKTTTTSKAKMIIMIGVSKF